LRSHCIRKLSLIVLVTSLFSAYSQEAALDSLSRTRLYLSGGLLWTRAFANYPLSNENDAFSSTAYKPVDTLNHYRPGLLLGADLHFFPGSAVMLLFGLHYTNTRSEYHSTYQSVSATSRIGYEKLTRTMETDYFFKYSALNVGAGMQVRLLKDVYLSGSFFVTRPLRITRSYKGTTEAVYETSNGAVDRELFRISEEEVRLSEKPANLSFRLGLGYQFKSGVFPSTLFIFRNFGMIFALPWYGLGYSISLSE